MANYSGALTGQPHQVEDIPPYHTAETAKIAEDRAKLVAEPIDDEPREPQDEDPEPAAE